MKRLLTTLATVMLFSGLAAGADVIPKIPPGTSLRIRLGTTLTSKTNKPGDTFRGEVLQDVVANGKTIVPEGSLVSGHVAFIKPSGRFRGKALMRVVLDSVTTPEDQKISLSSTLEDSKGGVCGNSPKDDEGTIQGCGKSKKVAAKDAALGGAIGAGAGATVGLGHEIDCAYYGNCGGPGLGTDVLAGAALGAGTALLFNLFEHEKEIILIQGSELNFVVNRTLDGAATGAASTTKKQ
ncbi:MAG: hypothetical protein DMG22_07475 [Acidobacteria bacterium]|nr:MAG: hypothetical protein DMG22_07475 [Acidobacteriota bacterium]